MSKIISDIVLLPKTELDSVNIESVLMERYQNLIRWAIISVENEKFCVSVSYEI